MLIAASIASVLIFGLRLGIDFVGGTLLEIEFANASPEKTILEEIFKNASLEGAQMQAIGEHGYLIRMKEIDETIHQQIVAELEKIGAQERRFDSIGPVIGKELREKTLWATFFVLMGIMLYIALAFRHGHRFVSGWRYGFIVLVTLLHDLVIPVGAFVLMGHFFLYEVNIPFVAALLLALGFSVTDTVVVFDRIRENSIKRREEDFYHIVSSSIRQTLVRSLNTSLTALLVIGALFVLGSPSLQPFAFTLGVAIIMGTYSSIFIASPLLYTSRQWSISKIFSINKRKYMKGP